MAEQSFPFENIDTTESQFSEWATNFQETGVQGSPTGTELGITVTGSDLNLTVAAGQAFIRGHYYINTSDLVIAVPTAGVNTRIDIVVVELDPEANTIVTKIVSGEAVAADPVAPTLTQSATGIYQLPIATLTIPTSTVALTAGMLLGTRTFMGNRVGIWTTATRPTNPTDYQTIGYNTTLEYHEFWDGSTWIALVAPPASANFVIDLDGSENNGLTFEFPKPAGPYSISLTEPDETFDIYLIDANGDSVGYSNNLAIVASADFQSVSILGMTNTQIVTFLFTGSVSAPTGEGNQVGAGAYLSSISPSELPNIDDTTTILGGNFATDVEIYFESGAYSEPAKSIVRTDATELVVTRPDNLTEDNSPYDLRAVNAGVTAPTGSGLNVLTDAVTAGSDPTWQTSSPLNLASVGTAFSQTLLATDSDGDVVDYSVTAGTLIAGLSLNAITGVLSGTPTEGGNATFTVTATDDGGNITSKEFEQPSQIASGGTVSVSGGYTYHSFTSSGTFEVFGEIAALECFVVAGGGGGGANSGSTVRVGGGGGAGGILLATVTAAAGSYAATVGSGGGPVTSGSNSSLGSLAIATGGGAGGDEGTNAQNGGSGGGAKINGSVGTGISGQGRNGGNGFSGGNIGAGGGGGGYSQAGGDASQSAQYGYGANDGGRGGNGTTFSNFFNTSAGGGGGGGTKSGADQINAGSNGGGRGASYGNNWVPQAGVVNTGGGGGGGAETNSTYFGKNGGSGRLIVRYAN